MTKLCEYCSPYERFCELETCEGCEIKKAFEEKEFPPAEHHRLNQEGAR